MIRRQKITTVIAVILLIIAIGAIEGAWWWLTPISIIGIAVCIAIGGLTKRQTNSKTVLKEYKIN